MWIKKNKNLLLKTQMSRKPKIIKQMFSIFAYFPRIQRGPNKNCKDNSSYNVKLLSRNDFDSVGDFDLELM